MGGGHRREYQLTASPETGQGHRKGLGGRLRAGYDRMMDMGLVWGAQGTGSGQGANLRLGVQGTQEEIHWLGSWGRWDDSLTLPEEWTEG